MKPNITIVDYYNSFIKSAKEDKIKYTNHLNTLLKLEKVFKDKITEDRDLLASKYNINYNIIDNVEIAKYSSFYVMLTTLIKTIDNIKESSAVYTLSRYIRILMNIENCKSNIEYTEKRNTISKKQYKEIVSKYYNKVHEYILRGAAYRYGNGLGTYKVTNCELYKPLITIDYDATNKNKKKLLEEGKEIYSEKKAKWCKEHNEEYNVPDYRVFKTISNTYSFKFCDSKYCPDKYIDYDRTEYVYVALRKYGYEYVADNICKSEKDIYELPTDIRYKLICLLHKYPTKSIQYERDEKAERYKRRANNSKNR